MGLREKQRAKREAAILAAAAELFGTKGYSATNVEDIAEAAEVGVATIYKYFGAKGGLIRELLRPQVLKMEAAAEAVVEKPSDDPAESISNVMACYAFTEGWQQRDLLLSMAGMDLGYAEVLQGVRDQLDRTILAQLKKLLQHFAATGKLVVGLDLDDLAEIIYGLQNIHFQYFVLHPEISWKELEETQRRRTHILFQPWTTD